MEKRYPELEFTIMIVVPRRNSLKSECLNNNEHIKRQINTHLQGVGFFMRIIADSKGKEIVEKYMDGKLNWELRNKKEKDMILSE